MMGEVCAEFAYPTMSERSEHPLLPSGAAPAKQQRAIPVNKTTARCLLLLLEALAEDSAKYEALRDEYRPQLEAVLR